MPQETGFSLRHENKGPELSQSTIKGKNIPFNIFQIADISSFNQKMNQHNAISLKADKGVIFVYTNKIPLTCQ